MAARKITIKIGPKPVAPTLTTGPTSWTTVGGTCVYRLSTDFTSERPTYAYDFDETLVKLRTSDILPDRADKLREQHKTHNILIFSNQGGIQECKTTHIEVQKLMDVFESKLGIPCSFFYASNDDRYRKPFVGMVNVLRTLTNTKIEWYCGDAGGRDGDFNISDLYFANNAGIRYVTPEEVFKGASYRAPKKKSHYTGDVWRDGLQTKTYDIVSTMSDTDAVCALCPLDLSVRYLVIMVGPQGCGKSTLSAALAKTYGFGIINGDKLKTIAKMDAQFSVLRSNDTVRGIVIDNTNTKKETRDHWLAQSEGFVVLMVHFKLPKEQVFHLTRYREFHGGSHISSVAIHTTYEPPTDDEADQIVEFTSVVTSHPFDQKLRFVWR